MTFLAYCHNSYEDQHLRVGKTWQLAVGIPWSVHMNLCRRGEGTEDKLGTSAFIYIYIYTGFDFVASVVKVFRFFLGERKGWFVGVLSFT